uniref:Piwi domain-containing protein n=1 Tax=Steinernema glaseri TaxID=37863 RepID=A0A1I7ZYE4_9BILA
MEPINFVCVLLPNDVNRSFKAPRRIVAMVHCIADERVKESPITFVQNTQYRRNHDIDQRLLRTLYGVKQCNNTESHI